jgi:hypothetical protein
MFKTFKPVLIQLLWLLMAGVAAMLLTGLIVNWQFSQSEIDIYFNDTYYVIDTWSFIFPLFLVLGLLIFLAKEFRNNFNRSLPNIIIIITGITLIYFLSIAHRYFPVFEGWTIYPPLSAPEEKVVGGSEPDASDIIRYFLTGIQVIVTLALLHVAYHWGKSKK